MRVYFIKQYQMPDGVVIHPGQDVTMWDATPALESGAAVPYEMRRAYESQTEKKTVPQSSGAKKATRSAAAKKKTNKGN